MQSNESQASPRTRPSTYYKFRPYSSDPGSKERIWVRDTIFNNRVRFARLSELNDPFEGRPFMVPQFDDPKAQSAAVYASILEDVQKCRATIRMANSLIG
jgi:hypothetical protein